MDEILNIARKVNEAIHSDKIRRMALSSTLAVQKDRIFSKGQNESGGRIGTYSKVYGEYKSKKGKNPGYVNFRDTDQMMGDYGVVIQGDQYALGFQNPTNAAKAGFLSDRYGDVFHANDNEVDVSLNVLVDELNKSL